MKINKSSVKEACGKNSYISLLKYTFLITITILNLNINVVVVLWEVE